MLKSKYKLNNEEGSGLVLALMVLLVLSVLGSALGVLTIGSLKLSDVNHDSNSAYYIAEAGVNMAYEEFKEIVKDSYDQNIEKNNPDSYFQLIIDYSKDQINKTDYYPSFDTQLGDIPAVTVSVLEPPKNTGEVRDYIIKSTGEVSGKERTVSKIISVTWIAPINEEGAPKFSFPKIPKDAVLINSREMKTDGGTVSGDVYLTNKDEGYKLNGNLGTKEKLTSKDLHTRFTLVEDWDFNNDWQINNSWKFTIDEQVTIDWNKYNKYMEKINDESYKTLELSNPSQVLEGNYRLSESKLNKSYSFNVEDNEVIILVDEIDLNGRTIEVKGNGSLTFIVNNDVKVQSNSQVQGDIFGKKDIKIGKNSRINGAITSGEDITIESGTSITGNILARKDVKIDGNVPIKGNVTSGKDITIESGTSITGNILAQEDVKIDENVPIKGNVTSGKDITVESGASITGNILARKDVKIDGNVPIKGNVTSGKDITIESGTSITGNILAQEDIKVDENVPIKGNVVLGKDVTVEKGSSITGNIFASKDVKFGDKSVIAGNIVSGKDVTIKKGSTVNGVILAKEDVEVEEKTLVSGSIVSKKVKISGRVTYKVHTIDDILFGESVGQSNDVDIEELVDPGPTIESD